jgi:hypothetical protein
MFNLFQSRNYVEQVISEVETWENIDKSAHRFGGTQFNLGKTEIGHIHSNGVVDIPFLKKVKEVLIREKKASVHHYSPNSGWTSFYIKSESDVNNTLWLLKISYLLKIRDQEILKIKLPWILNEINDLELSTDLGGIIKEELNKKLLNGST